MIETYKKKLPTGWSALLIVLGLVGWQLYVAGVSGVADAMTLIDHGARRPTLGFPQAPWRLVASIFLHGGWVHLVTNSVLILLWGRQLARMIGEVGLVATFLVTGVWGNLASDIYGPNALAVGASGGAAGLVLMVLVIALLDPRNKGWSGEAGSWAKSSVAVVVLNVMMALGITSVGTARLDHWAHTGGAVAGAVLGLLCARQGQTRRVWLMIALGAVAAYLVIWSRGTAPFG